MIKPTDGVVDSKCRVVPTYGRSRSGHGRKRVWVGPPCFGNVSGLSDRGLGGYLACVG